MAHRVAHSLTFPNVDGFTQYELMDQNNLSNVPTLPNLDKPYVEIIEQPSSESFTFRYGSEIKGKSLGSVLGVHSTPDSKTFPEIKVVNYTGPFAVVGSCVTEDGPPHRPHPHKLFGNEYCDKTGVYKNIINNSDMTCSFRSLGIQCVKREEKEESLRAREEKKLDPYGTGFKQSENIDLQALRLCFQVFVRGSDNRFSVPLDPVVSDPIYNRKNCLKLNIVKLSHYSAPAAGGTEVILLCDPVDREDIEVWFYEKQGTAIVWESQASFHPTDVHRKVAVSFKTPRYTGGNIQRAVKVFVELRKPKTNHRSEPRDFEFISVKSDLEKIGGKRVRSPERINLDSKRYMDNLKEHDPSKPTYVPRTSKKTSRLKKIAESDMERLDTKGNNPYHQPSTFLTFAGMNDLSASSDAHSHASAQATPIIQPSTSFQECRSSISTSVPATVVGSSASPQLAYKQLPRHTGLSNIFSQVSVTSSIDILPSTMVQESSTSLPQYRFPIVTTMPGATINPSDFNLTYTHLSTLGTTPAVPSQSCVIPPVATLASSVIPQTSTSFKRYRFENGTTMPAPTECSSISSHFTPAHLPFLAASSGVYSQKTVTPTITTQPLAITPQCSTSFDNYRYPDSISMPNPAECPSTSSDFTSAHLPFLDASPGVYSQASVTPTIATKPLAITPQCSTLFESYRSSNLTTTFVPVVSSFYIPDIAAVSDPHSVASESSMTDNLEEMLHQYHPSDISGTENAEEVMLEKFDSLDLNMTLSASIFDSGTNITDYIYEETSSSANKKQ